MSITASPSSVSTTFLLLRRRGVPSGISPSARTNLGAGHGRACGKATTKKLANRVVANREDVNRLRGCKWGGMFGGTPVGLNEWNCAAID